MRLDLKDGFIIENDGIGYKLEITTKKISTAPQTKGKEVEVVDRRYYVKFEQALQSALDKKCMSTTLPKVLKEITKAKKEILEAIKELDGRV